METVVAENNVIAFPAWKENATAAERFMELAALATEQPELFSKVIIGYVETLTDHSVNVRYASVNTEDPVEFIGVIQLVADKYLRDGYGN